MTRLNLHDDDVPVGTILSRRDAVAVLGASGLALMLGHRPRMSSPVALPQGVCVVRPAQTEGPYFVDEQLNRSDIRSDPSDGTMRPGTPLELTINVFRASAGCAPLAGAIVDLWQCDHFGVYSDAQDPSFSTRGKKFLRGYQVTDARGAATFTTIYPGWYRGRTVHLHFKVRSAFTSPSYEFTSQLYFDDALTDRVHALAPYAEKGARTTRNERDGIFRRGGSQLVLAPTPKGAGYAATFGVGLQV